MLRNGHFQIVAFLLYATTINFSYFHTNSIAMLYLVHKYKKKLESTNMDLTHSKIMIFIAFLVRGYGCSTSHTIVPFTIGCKFRTFSGHSKSIIRK